MLPDTQVSFEVDAAWIIALWLAIHDGDPPLEGVVAHDLQQGAALIAMSALSEALDAPARNAVQQVLAPIQKQFSVKTVDANVAAERLQAMRIRVTEDAGGHARAATVTAEVPRPRPYCIRFQGQIICVWPPFPHTHTPE
jgi:hypothetical protein